MGRGATKEITKDRRAGWGLNDHKGGHEILFIKLMVLKKEIIRQDQLSRGSSRDGIFMEQH